LSSPGYKASTASTRAESTGGNLLVRRAVNRSALLRPFAQLASWERPVIDGMRPGATPFDLVGSEQGTVDHYSVPRARPARIDSSLSDRSAFSWRPYSAGREG